MRYHIAVEREIQLQVTAEAGPRQESKQGIATKSRGLGQDEKNTLRVSMRFQGGKKIKINFRLL